MSEEKKKTVGGMTELEMGVLGAAVLEPVRVMSLVSDWGASEDWFESKTAQTIFKVMMKMFVDGEPVDLLTVSERVRLVAGSIGVAAVEAAMDFVPSAAYGEYYMDMLRDAWFTRVCRGVGIDMSSRLTKGDVDRRLVVDEAINTLVGLVAFSTKGKERSSQDLRREVFQEWKDAAAGIKDAMGLPFPFAGVNALTCGIPEGLTVIAARPSVGKTVMEGEISRHLMMRGYRVARVCLDMNDKPFVSRDISALAGESLNKMRAGFMFPGAVAKIEGSLLAMDEWKEELVRERTSAGIISKLRALLANGGLDLVTIDYIQLVDTVGEEKYAVNDNVRIARAMARFKDFNRTTGVPVIILSQLSRGMEKEDRMPQLSDLRDSGSIEQDATMVAFLYPEPKVTKAWCESAGVDTFKQLSTRPIMFDVQKQQNGAVGKIAMRQFGEYFKFEECGPQDPNLSNLTDCHSGYDFMFPREPVGRDDEQNVYSVCKHAGGSVAMFMQPWFEKINAAVPEGGRYVHVERAVGVLNAVATMSRVRDQMKRESKEAGSVKQPAEQRLI